MIIVYHGAKPYLPSLACALHLGLSHEAEGFFQECAAYGDKPLQVIGPDEQGNIVCCLVHGRREGLYKRVLEGAAGVFDIPIRCLNVEQIITPRRFAFKTTLPLTIAKFFPEFLGQYQHKKVAQALSSQLVFLWEGEK